MMFWRKSYLWALGAVVALAAALAFGGHPGLAVGGAGSVSAPSVPSASVDSAPVANLLQTHFDGNGHALRGASLSRALRATGTMEAVRPVAGGAQPYYGPLHRRPPPSLS